MQKNRNVLLSVRVDLESSTLRINASDESHCDQYVLVSEDSVCTITALIPLTSQDTSLTNRYASLFLVGLNRYFYIVFDQKFEYLNEHCLLIVFYNLRFSTNATLLSKPHCLTFLQKYITLKKLTTKLVTEVKIVIALSNGNILVMFENQYCIIHITQYLNVRIYVLLFIDKQTKFIVQQAEHVRIVRLERN